MSGGWFVWKLMELDRILEKLYTVRDDFKKKKKKLACDIMAVSVKFYKKRRTQKNTC